MKYTNLLAILLLLVLIAAIPLVPVKAQTRGAQIDILRHIVIRTPDASLIAMQTNVADMSPGQIRTSDIEKQDSDGMLVTQDLGFHMGFIAYNVRDTATIQSYYRTNINGHWPLHDVEFRHALIHSYDQLGIIPPIYGYVVTPVRSLVPPAQSKYYSPDAQTHPYNPGNPLTSVAGDGTSCGILKAAGYTFVDAGTTGVVDDFDYWNMPNGQPLPHMEIWTPLAGDAPTSFQHGAEFVADLALIGLASTSNNGGRGMLNVGRAFSTYLTECRQGLFDAFMVFWTFGRLPSQLFDALHTSQDSRLYNGRDNSPGVNDATIDALVEDVKYSLNPDDIEVAAKQVQVMLYDPELPNADNFALSYMLLYSRSYFDVYDQNAAGVVKSPGYGSDNTWTWINVHWKPGLEYTEGGKTVFRYINGLPPSSLNPMYAITAYEWNIITQVLDGLTNVNPYNHADMPWIATDWSITELVSGGMEIDMTIRDDVKWQDGWTVTAYDIEWCLEFIRNYQVPRYAATWEQLTDVQVTDATHLKIIMAEPGLSLFYDVTGLGLLAPQHIWDRFGDYNVPANRLAVLSYDPSEGYNLAPGYTQIPGATPPTTNLFGTGPFEFQFYDSTNNYDDMWKNEEYFMTQADVATLMEQMFWEVGDQSRDGLVDVVDLNAVSAAFGYSPPGPPYDPNADFDTNNIVDMRDMRQSAFHLTWQKEYQA